MEKAFKNQCIWYVTQNRLELNGRPFSDVYKATGLILSTIKMEGNSQWECSKAYNSTVKTQEA